MSAISSPLVSAPWVAAVVRAQAGISVVEFTLCMNSSAVNGKHEISWKPVEAAVGAGLPSPQRCECATEVARARGKITWGERPDRRRFGVSVRWLARRCVRRSIVGGTKSGDPLEVEARPFLIAALVLQLRERRQQRAVVGRNAIGALENGDRLVQPIFLDQRQTIYVAVP